MLDTCAAARDLIEALSCLLLLQGEVEGAVVGSDGLDLAVDDGFLQGCGVLILTDGGAQDELRTIGTGINAVIEQQILGAGFDKDLHASLSSSADFFHTQLAGQMDNVNRGVNHLCNVADAVDGLSLQIVRLGNGVACGAGNAGVQNFLLQHGDQRTVLAVDAADTVDGLQLLQNCHGVDVIDGNAVSGVGLVSGNTLILHGLDLGLDAFVPVGDGHMDAVVAGNILGQVLPDFHGVDQSVTLFLGSHVHAGGGTAADSATGTGFKIVGSMAQCVHQVQMSVSVDKAGEHDTAANVYDIAAGKIFADVDDFVAIHGQVSLLQAFGSNQRAVFQDRHNYRSPS